MWQGAESDLWKLRVVPADNQPGRGNLYPTTARNEILSINPVSVEKDPEPQMR